MTEIWFVFFLTLMVVLENASSFFTPQRQWIAGAPPTSARYLLRCSNNKKTVHSDKEPLFPESRTLVDVDSNCRQRSHAEGLLVFKDDEDYIKSLHHLSCWLDCTFHGWVATLFKKFDLWKIEIWKMYVKYEKLTVNFYCWNSFKG